MTNYIYLIGFYNQGIIDKKSIGELDMFKTMNNDYTIETIRKSVKNLWSSNHNYEYLCKLTFKNILNQIVYELILNENDVSNLIEFMHQMFIYNLNENYIAFESKSTIARYTTFKIDKVIKNNKIIMIMTISEYDSSTELIIPKISIEFDESYFNNFLHFLYFNFLIDIDSSTNNDDILNYIPFL